MAGVNDISDDEDFEGEVEESRGKKVVPPKKAVNGGEGADDGEEVVILEDDEKAAKRLEKEGDDERLSAAQRAEEEGEGDESEDEARRRQNRERRREAKDRRHRAKTRDKVELNFLRKQNEELEKVNRRLAAIEQHQVGSGAQNIDNRIEQENARLAQADNLLAAAIESQNGTDAVKLTKIRDNIRDRIQGLKASKAEYEQAAKSLEQEETRRSSADDAGGGTDPVAHANALVFYRRHRDWYDPQGNDQDSAVVMAIDSALGSEGYDARTRRYWEELERRCSKLLPHRFKKVKNVRDQDEEIDDESDEDQDDDQDSGEDLDDDQPPRVRKEAKTNGKNKPRGPRMPTGGEGGGGSNRFYISPARKKALVDNGLWDDPVLRSKYVKRYAAWDKENPSGRDR